MEQQASPMYTIRIFDNNCTVEVQHKNHNPGNLPVHTHKTLKLESLIKAFQSTDTKIESPILPLNTIKYQELGSSISVVLYHAPTIFTASYYDNKYENCRRPGLIVKYELGIESCGEEGNKYFIQDTRCFGVIDNSMLFSNRTQLYALPFPNIDSDGHVCWGSTSIDGAMKSLTGLSMYINRLFNSPFNEDIFNDSLMCNHGINNPGDLFAYIQDKDVFPTELFENLGREFTLGKL